MLAAISAAEISHFIESTNKLSHRIRFFKKRNSIYSILLDGDNGFSATNWHLLVDRISIKWLIFMCNFTKFNLKLIMSYSNWNSQEIQRIRIIILWIEKKRKILNLLSIFQTIYLLRRKKTSDANFAFIPLPVIQVNFPFQLIEWQLRFLVSH